MKTNSEFYSVFVFFSVFQQLSEMLLSALNQNLVQFTLRPGVQVTVYAAHHSAGKQTQTPLPTFGILNRSITGNNAQVCLDPIKNGMDSHLMEEAALA